MAGEGEEASQVRNGWGGEEEGTIKKVDLEQNERTSIYGKER